MNYVGPLFAATTLATLLLFANVIRKSAVPEIRRMTIPFVVGALIWLALQAVITINGVYSNHTDAIPPRIALLGILPAIVAIVLLFCTVGGRKFIDSLPLKHLTWVNIVRLPVEIVLYGLFLNKAVPEIMTFEGWNFDILSGMTAPVIVCFSLSGRKIGLVWNIICLGLLLNIVVIALLSAPSPVQRLAFDQPNMAILNFPFSWLPTFIVPVILFGHLVVIRRTIH